MRLSSHSMPDETRVLTAERGSWVYRVVVPKEKRAWPGSATPEQWIEAIAGVTTPRGMY